MPARCRRVRWRHNGQAGGPSKGAGHLCPLTQPERTFAMMDRFVNGEAL